jgi:hypothetical protein
MPSARSKITWPRRARRAGMGLPPCHVRSVWRSAGVRRIVRAVLRPRTSCSGCCFRRAAHIRFCAARIRARVARECGGWGWPFFAALIFLRVSGERGFPLSSLLICARCSGVNGLWGWPFFAALIFLRVSGESCLPLLAALIRARVAGESVFPLRAAAIFARVSRERGWPFFAALIFLRVSGECGWRGWPLNASLLFACVSGKKVLPLLLC